MKQTVPLNGAGYEPGVRIEVEGLRALLAEREERIADKDARIAELQADKEDLRRRLDQATALLTDQREKAAVPTSAWGRFLAWRTGR